MNERPAKYLVAKTIKKSPRPLLAPKLSRERAKKNGSETANQYRLNSPLSIRATRQLVVTAA